MNDQNSRYVGPPTVLYSYTDEYAVECPACHKEALVTPGNSTSRHSGNLKCENCSHSEQLLDRVRYEATVKRNCDECGKEFKVTVDDLKTKANDITIPCPHCGTVRTYKPTYDMYRLGYTTKGMAADPLLGLPLWFQADVRGNLFWAFNRRHLGDIKTYVAAKLRERQTQTHSTMVEKLPQFIKSAKNRDLLIKVIERLERKNG